MTRFATTPKVAVAGKRLTASATIRSSTGGRISSARVTCAAKAGSTRLRVLARHFRASAATCTWRVPAGARGKRLTGTVKVQSGAAVVTKRFSKKIQAPADV